MKKPLKKAPRIKKKTTKPPIRRSARVIKKIIRKAIPSIKAGIPRIVPSKAAPTAESFSPRFELPAHYGNNHAVLCVRDPWWIYCYWEIMTEPINRLLEQMRRLRLRPEKAVLRVFDVTEIGPEGRDVYFDIQLFEVSENFAWPMTGDWMIDTGKPDREWVVALGIRAHGGRFFELVRSNRVHTPRYGLSDVIDQEWAPLDLFSGDLKSLQSSLHVQSSRSVKPS